MSPVTAYNVLTLLSFWLSAATADLPARHLALSPGGAALAALAFAFSPFHLAHAAYHVHIAQTQWPPLYLLALFRCLDEPTPKAVGLPSSREVIGVPALHVAGFVIPDIFDRPALYVIC